MFDDNDILSYYPGTSIVSLDPFNNDKIKRLKSIYKNILIPEIVIDKIYLHYLYNLGVVFIFYHYNSNISLIHSLILNLNILKPIRLEKQLVTKEFINSLVTNNDLVKDDVLII